MEIEIKFRGWNGRIMNYYPSWFTLNKNKTLCFEKPPHHYVDDSDVDYPERIILTEYIGLKDKTGNDIYEGDLFDAGIGNFFKVYRNKKYARFSVKIIRTNGKMLGISKPKISDLKNMCIVGNIFENSDLVKIKK